MIDIDEFYDNFYEIISNVAYNHIYDHEIKKEITKNDVKLKIIDLYNFCMKNFKSNNIHSNLNSEFLKISRSIFSNKRFNIYDITKKLFIERQNDIIFIIVIKSLMDYLGNPSNYENVKFHYCFTKAPGSDYYDFKFGTDLISLDLISLDFKDHDVNVTIKFIRFDDLMHSKKDYVKIKHNFMTEIKNKEFQGMSIFKIIHRINKFIKNNKGMCGNLKFNDFKNYVSNNDFNTFTDKNYLFNILKDTVSFEDLSKFVNDENSKLVFNRFFRVEKEKPSKPYYEVTFKRRLHKKQTLPLSTYDYGCKHLIHSFEPHIGICGDLLNSNKFFLKLKVSIINFESIHGIPTSSMSLFYVASNEKFYDYSKYYEVDMKQYKNYDWFISELRKMYSEFASGK